MSRIGQKWDKSGTFSDQISVHSGALPPRSTPYHGCQVWPQNGSYWHQIGRLRDYSELKFTKIIIFKSPRFVPFWANLTQFGGKPGIPGGNMTTYLPASFSNATARLFNLCKTARDILSKHKGTLYLFRQTSYYANALIIWLYPLSQYFWLVLNFIYLNSKGV